MIKRLAKSFLLTLFLAGFAHSEPTPVGPFNFAKGLNLSQIASDIGDDESPDLCNCINTLNGGLFKRKGSSRYISQAQSTQPVTSLFVAYATTGTVTKKTVLATIGNKIVYSTSDIAPQWLIADTVPISNQPWDWTVMNNKAIGTGGTENNIKQFDLITASETDLLSVDNTTSPIALRAKYGVMSKNYLIVGNVQVSTETKFLTGLTTYYASRIYYSLLNQQSSMTAQRFIEYRTNDGEQITGIGSLFNAVDIFKQTSIGEITFTNLNVPSLGGDWVLTEKVTAYGLFAPRTLVNTGQYYIFGSKDGIRLWNNAVRLTAAYETQIISDKIRPLIQKLIRAKTYENSAAIYYPKKNWYILFYEDPDKFPHGVLNSVIVCDLNTGEWFPFCNWLAASMALANGPGDNGALLYGDSMDGYVHIADLDTRVDDSRKEISVSPMDDNTQWTGSSQDTVNVLEGTASLKIALSATVTQSSMTYMGVINAGEWYDKSKITKNDKLSFKVYPSTLGNISSLRVDLEVNDIANAFDTNFTSVTLSSAALISGNTSWTTFEIPLSSFPIRSDWANLTTENVPFANTQTYFGIRFVLNGISTSSVSLDDVRVVGATDNKVKAYRFTKLYNLGSMAFKNYGKVLLTRDKTHDASFSIDIYNDFGQRVRTETQQATIPKSIYVLGLGGTPGITRMDSRDFSVLESTTLPFDALNGVADNNFLYLSDRMNDRLIKIDRSSIAALTATYGAFGSGTTNFNLIHQLTVDNDDSLFLIDMNNQRVKEHKKSTLSYVRQMGSLGFGTTNFHQLTGISADENYIYVADEGNYRLLKFERSTFSLVVNLNIDYNTIGDSSLQVDDKYIYLACNRISDTSINFQDVVLEKRDKGDLHLISRVRVTPLATTALSTYTIMGDIALLGPYVFIPFTDDPNVDGTGGHYYIQKRLRSDFSLVSEYSTTKQLYSVIGDGISYDASIRNDSFDIGNTGKYIQLKYYDDDLDNNFVLYNQTFLLNEKPLSY